MKWLQRALKLRIELYGSDHVLVTSTMVLLGKAYLAKNDLSRAEALLSDAIRIRERVLGRFHVSLSVPLSEVWDKTAC